MWNFSLWRAMTGSNWFRREHILKERSEAQNVVSRGCRRLYDYREKRKMAIKNPTARSTWNFSLWWAKTGSNWFRSAHILKERSEAQNVVSRGCRRLHDRREKGKRQEKRPHGADHMRSSLWWAKTGSNWFRSEHILKEQSDAQNVVSRGCRRLYDCREKREMAIKNSTARSTWNFSLWRAMTGSNWFRSEHRLKEQGDAQMIVSRGCRRLYDCREKRKKARKKHHGADHVMLSFGGR